jgi:filamentous hemagglutinin family protein
MQLKTNNRLLSSLVFLMKCRLLVCLGLFVSQSGAIAQIIPDGTLPNPSVAARTGQTTQITGGTTQGNNLFHSFRQFSVPTGETAFFNNASTIDNVLVRVTGGSLSRIDGLIRANGHANFLLLNPQGILFGANARLDIGGSFLGSTANSMRFSDGSEFSAVNPQASPLLTMSVPTGLQFGANPGRIVVQGSGNNLSVNPEILNVIRDQRSPGLQVPLGQTLALVGGSVNLQGGNVIASSGRIELGSVNAAGTVALMPLASGWSFGYAAINQFGDIRLSQTASADTSGNSGGSLHVQGRRVMLTDGSSLLAMTEGAATGGTLAIDASDSVQVTGVTRNAAGDVVFPSSIYTDVAAGAVGRGSHLNIRTGLLRVSEGGQISSSTYGAGNTGNLRVSAQTVELLSGAPIVGSSGLFMSVNDTNATGSAGQLVLNSDRLLIDGGATATSTTFGIGNAGHLQVNARQIDITGVSPGGSLSGLYAQVEEGATGSGGNLDITTNQLHLSNGARIATVTFGAGNAGSIHIQANTVDLSGFTTTSQGDRATTITTSTRSTGNGSNLTLNTNHLQVLDGAQIAVSTGGSGNAGTLRVTAHDIDLSGTSGFGRSGLFASAIVGTGAGGDIWVRSDRLSIRDGATVNASNLPSLNLAVRPGRGTAGNINVSTNQIQLDNGSITAASAGGDRGNITLQAQTIFSNRDSAITTNAQGRATGGNIAIQTEFLAAQNNSDITANAVNNRGGQVRITAQGIFGAEYRPHTTLLSDITASSNLGAEFNGIVELNTPGIDPSQGLIELPGTVIDPDTQVATACENQAGNNFIVTGRGGLPEDASQLLRGQAVWQDTRSLDPENQTSQTAVRHASEKPSRAGSSAPDSVIEAQGWSVDSEGEVRLVAESPQGTIAEPWRASSRCSQ